MLEGGWVGLFGAIGGLSGVTGGQFGAFFYWIDGPILPRNLAKAYGYSALNFGNAKGLEFDRVLIIPHGPIKKYLKSGDVNDVKGSLSKFYVAVTRAKHSVAFLYDGECTKSSNISYWKHLFYKGIIFAQFYLVVTRPWEDDRYCLFLFSWRWDVLSPVLPRNSVELKNENEIRQYNYYGGVFSEFHISSQSSVLFIDSTPYHLAISPHKQIRYKYVLRQHQ